MFDIWLELDNRKSSAKDTLKLPNFCIQGIASNSDTDSKEGTEFILYIGINNPSNSIQSRVFEFESRTRAIFHSASREK